MKKFLTVAMAAMLAMSAGLSAEYRAEEVTPEFDSFGPFSYLTLTEETRSYDAIRCTIDGESFELEGDQLILNEDGTGTIHFSGSDFEIQWKQEGIVFSFEDESGDTFIGSVEGDQIYGIYNISFSNGTTKEYEYVFQDPNAKEHVHRYEAVSCTMDGEDYKFENDALVLYLNGSGYVRYDDADYVIFWSVRGENFEFYDEGGDYFEGTISENEITGVYTITLPDETVCEYEYVYQMAEEELDPADHVRLFQAIECMSGEEDCFTEGERIALYDYGTGMIRFYMDNLYMEWTLEEDKLTFTDDFGDCFEGTIQGNQIVGVYSVTRNDGTISEYSYVFELLEEEAEEDTGSQY